MRLHCRPPSRLLKSWTVLLLALAACSPDSARARVEGEWFEFDDVSASGTFSSRLKVCGNRDVSEKELGNAGLCARLELGAAPPPVGTPLTLRGEAWPEPSDSAATPFIASAGHAEAIRAVHVTLDCPGAYREEAASQQVEGVLTFEVAEAKHLKGHLRLTATGTLGRRSCGGTQDAAAFDAEFEMVDP